MTCIQCGKDIKRGQRFKSPTLTTLKFCSEICYNQYLKGKENSPIEKLKRYINKIAPDSIDWAYLMRQIKNICKEFEIDESELLKTIVYGHEYCNEPWDNEWMLYCFVPKYIWPMREFVDTIERNKRAAQNWVEDAVEIVKPSKRKYTKSIDFN